MIVLLLCIMKGFSLGLRETGTLPITAYSQNLREYARSNQTSGIRGTLSEIALSGLIFVESGGDALSCYWARFEKKEVGIFRFDTRVYLNSVEIPSANDQCIGAVVGKNPGSAVPACYDNNDLQEIVLDSDQLLPNIRSILIKAFKYSEKKSHKNSYMQVLNLFYVCDNNLIQAIRKIETCQNRIICDAEDKYFPFIWYVWGGDNKDLNIYKERFAKINSNSHFYLNTKTKEVIEYAPGFRDSARHTQGLKHDLIVPHISKVI